MKHFFTTNKNYSKLSECISEQFAFLSLSSIKSQIKQGEVRVGGQVIKQDCEVEKGQEVKIFLPEKLEEKQSAALNIVYKDENIVVVNKPILCETETHLIKMVQAQFPNAAPCHRLDRNTAGLIIFALHKNAQKEIFLLMKAQKIDKFYHAKVIGKLQKSEDTITVYLKKDTAASKVFVSAIPKDDYLTATLYYKTLQYNPDTNDSLLEVKLITGRTHQIRATFAFLGHPIIGDGKYGFEKENRLRKTKYQNLTATKIHFNFSLSDSKILGYLGGKVIEL
ncbi:MAG: RluA family pseudouridine synthase [Firmicutes bacterium]|nr:RluA family pseudouridine synthase [Bacillota bacterium]